MSDLETRLRETLDTVARQTRIEYRIDEIERHRRRWLPGALVAAAVFVGVIVLLGLPLFLGGLAENSLQPAATPKPSATEHTDQPFDIDPSWFTVEADDFEVFDAMTDLGAEAHGPGWRASLRSEAVWCLHRGGPGASTRASEFPIEEELTLEVIEAECATGNDSARNLEAPPQNLTFCRGTFTESVYAEWIDSTEYELISGRIDGPLPGFPVVLGWESDCVSEEVDTTDEVALDADLSVEEINRVRDLEIALTGASHQNCFTYDQASQLADEARGALGDHWLRVIFTPVDRDLPGQCYQPLIDLQWGAIWVVGVDDPGSSWPPTDITVPPSLPDD